MIVLLFGSLVSTFSKASVGKLGCLPAGTPTFTKVSVDKLVKADGLNAGRYMPKVIHASHTNHKINKLIFHKANCILERDICKEKCQK